MPHPSKHPVNDGAFAMKAELHWTGRWPAGNVIQAVAGDKGTDMRDAEGPIAEGETGISRAIAPFELHRPGAANRTVRIQFSAFGAHLSRLFSGHVEARPAVDPAF
jgi:hypothetical protein